MLAGRTSFRRCRSSRTSSTNAPADRQYKLSPSALKCGWRLAAFTKRINHDAESSGSLPRAGVEQVISRIIWAPVRQHLHQISSFDFRLGQFFGHETKAE